MKTEMVAIILLMSLTAVRSRSLQTSKDIDTEDYTLGTIDGQRVKMYLGQPLPKAAPNSMAGHGDGAWFGRDKLDGDQASGRPPNVASNDGWLAQSYRDIPLKMIRWSPDDTNELLLSVDYPVNPEEKGQITADFSFQGNSWSRGQPSGPQLAIDLLKVIHNLLDGDSEVLPSNQLPVTKRAVSQTDDILTSVPIPNSVTRSQKVKILEELQKYPRWRQRLNIFPVQDKEASQGQSQGRLSVGLEVAALSRAVVDARERHNQKNLMKFAHEELQKLGRR